MNSKLAIGPRFSAVMVVLGIVELSANRTWKRDYVNGTSADGPDESMLVASIRP